MRDQAGTGSEPGGRPTRYEPSVQQPSQDNLMKGSEILTLVTTAGVWDAFEVKMIADTKLVLGFGSNACLSKVICFLATFAFNSFTTGGNFFQGV